MRWHNYLTRGIVAGALLAFSACDSLDVTNPNNPDTKRALSDPGGLRSVAGGTFRTWFQTTQSMWATGPLVTMADSYTASWNNYNMRRYSSQPRTIEGSWGNDPADAARASVEQYWYGYYSALSSANDVVGAIRVANIEIFTPEETKMVETAAVMGQAMNQGALSLHYDRGFVVDETSNLSALTIQTRQAMRDAALANYDEVVTLAAANDFEFPASWFNGHTYDNHQVAALANTMAAQLIAYFPRNSAENTAADWAKVVSYASKGISSGVGTPAFDLLFTGNGGSFYDELKAWSNDITTMRVDTRVAKLLDPATQSDPWPDPNGNPLPNSPDKRLGNGTYATAADEAGFGTRAATAGAGTDFAWSSQAIFRPARGQYHQSNIAHIRYDYASFSDLGGSGGGFGDVPVLTATENDLLWAEGLIRSGGSLATAATLINKTRVGRGGLAPAAAGDGVAGLLTKLQYEQEIELMGLGPQPYFNRRRIDGLQPNTPHQMPIPAKELGVLQMELYTFGGASAPVMSIMKDRSAFGLPVLSHRKR